MTARRPAVPFLVALAALVLLAFTGSATGASTGVGVLSAPRRVVQGDMARFSVSVRPANARCSFSVRYRGGSRQRGLDPVVAEGGVATWRWQVPLHAAAGLATATASCGSAGHVTRRILVVGQTIAPRITVERKGFSIRANPYGGTSVSYGLILANDSKTLDALDVYVLVNFVMADNKLLGTATTNVRAIAAGGTYALGSDLGFPAAAPIDRLEVVVRVGSHARHSLVQPALANVHVVPDLYEPGWLGSVEGEVINDQARLTLQNARLSAVVFDASGAVLGGGTGYAFAQLPPATREVFKITTGLRAIPFDRAADVAVSSEPTYLQAT